MALIEYMQLLIQKSKHKRTKVKAAFVLLAAVMISTSALARDYKVELLVFRNLVESRANEPQDYTAPQAMTSNSETWLLEPTMLLEQAEVLNNSRDYELLYHYSWGQESLPFSQSASYRIAESQLSGWIRVYATQLLFTNIDIDFNGYRLQETRRLKLDERHFFDHPKFGLLLQVSRLEENVEDDGSLRNSGNELLPSR